MAIGLDDTDRKISAVDTKLKQLNSSSSAGGEAPKLLSGRGGFDDNGRWVLIPAKASTPDSDESTDSKTDPQGDATKRFANIIQNDLDKTKENEFTKALIVSAYTGVELADSMETKSAAELVVQRDELVGRKEALENSFKQAKEAFIQVLSESVQKLLSIKIFFDHATVKGGNNDKLPNGVGLIVTNCKASKLIDGKIKNRQCNIWVWTSAIKINFGLRFCLTFWTKTITRTTRAATTILTAIYIQTSTTKTKIKFRPMARTFRRRS